MSDQNEKAVASPEEITEFLKKEFVFTDNIPEDMNRRRAIVMEARASILIDSYCTAGRFPTFMKAGRHDESAWIYTLPQSVEYPFANWGENFVITLDEFKIIESNTFSQQDRWQFILRNFAVLKKSNGDTLGIDDNTKSLILSKLKESEQFLVSAFGSKFKICKHSPYNTPEKVCRFFGNAPFPFATLKLNNSVLRPDIFHDQEKAATESVPRWERNKRECSEEDSIQLILSQIISKSQETSIVPSIYGKPCKKWLRMVYEFKNEYDEVVMKVAKLYDAELQTKSLIPMTMWMRNNSTTDQLFCVPLPEDKQPLYNLDQLKADQESPVILTDSIELADANELDGVIFTSFICDLGQYNQVDWSPLLNRTIYYLVTNHSGSSLESAYLKANELSEYLEEKEEINLKFIQLSVDYPEKKHFALVDDILKHYQDSEPVPEPESVEIFEDYESFEAQYKAIIKLSESRPRKPWEKHSQNGEEQRVVEKENNRRKPVNYVLRPFLIKGEASMLYASKSTGKSALGISMAAAVVSGKPLLSEKWWVVPENPDYPMNKVLYLDFENGEDEIKNRKVDFAYPYWSQDEVKCANNLIVEDMTKDTVEKVDYSDPDNWQKIIKLIEAAKDKGTPGQPVDLLVIDTLSKFTGKPYTAGTSLSGFINRVRGMNIAILFLHHEGSNGAVRAWKCALDDFYFTLRMYRKDDNENHTLEDPLWLAYKPSRSGVEKIAPFEVKFNKKWSAHYGESDPEKSKPEEQRRKEELKRISDFYKKRGFLHQDIFPMLGISRAYYNELKNS